MDISSTYFHTMSISRWQGITDEWGKEVESYVPVSILQLVPCAFSQQSRNSKNNEQTESSSNIIYTNKIFCAPNLDIKAGDRITVYFGDRSLGEFTASNPFLYPTHQEVPITRKDEA